MEHQDAEAGQRRVRLAGGLKEVSWESVRATESKAEAESNRVKDNLIRRKALPHCDTYLLGRSYRTFLTPGM